MERVKEVQCKRRGLWTEAYGRWENFAVAKRPLESAVRNIDGSIPRPAVAVSTPVQKSRFEERQRLRQVFESAAYRGIRIAAERQVGATLDFADLPPNEQALKAGRPVARLVSLGGNGIEPKGFATAFLVAKDVVLTNYHVFQKPSDAYNCGAQFLFERIEQGVRSGLIFELDPDRFFISNRELDYALVAVKPRSLTEASLDQFQYLPLIGAKGKIEKGGTVNIIQHPEGRPKQYATVNNLLLDLRDDGFLLYETDTLEGSSGSPVFSQWWEVIGLHHCGVPQMQDGKLVKRNGEIVPTSAEVDDDELIWIANEGVRVSAMVDSFKQQRVDGTEPNAILQRIIESTFDTLCLVATGSPLIQPEVLASPGGTPMASHTFQFSGPVTIYMGGDGAAVPAVAIPAAAPVVAATPAASPAPAVAAAVAAATEFFEKKLRFDENYASRDALGYDTTFLRGWRIPAPQLSAALEAKALKKKNGSPWVLKYYHYSLVMHEPRRLLIWAASNVDYSAAARKRTKPRKEYGGEDWRLDPRVALQAPGLQIEDVDFYRPATKIDRGHIVRREDACWGSTAKEAEFANSDTYHWTNCTPQSQAFNPSGEHGIWGKFEEHIQREAKALDGRVCVFAGPVLGLRDPRHGYDDDNLIKVPMKFWKIVMCVSNKDDGSEPLAYGFIFDQTEAIERLGFERMDMSEYEIYQVPVAEITRKTGVQFDDSVLAADVLRRGGANESLRDDKGVSITTLEDIVLR